MRTTNGYNISRIKNPCPKRWPGAWFSFATPNGSVGQANFKTLASYIGKEAYEEVKKHFACLRPKYTPPKYINLKLYIEDTPHNREVLHNLAYMATGFIRGRAQGNYGLDADHCLHAGGVASGV